jgi:glycosyltransferase involved in cell wall biosynthesis
MSQNFVDDAMVPADEVPVISIGMPIFNAGQYLRPAVLSIIQQTFTQWELIIIDDASTDGALDSIRDLDDPRIKIVEGAENRGLATRLNEAIALARGVYFARMDQDDISHPERLARQLDFLELQPDVDILGTRCVLINRHDDLAGLLEFPCSHHEICSHPWRSILLPHPTWMGRTIWFRSNPYLSPGPYFCEDQELLLRTHEFSRFSILPTALLAYRVRGPIPIKKLLKTRKTVFTLQQHYFVSKHNQVAAAKSLLLFFLKSMRDLMWAALGGRRNSACAGVRLVPLSTEVSLVWKGTIASCGSK